MWKRKALVLIVDELQTVEPPGMRALRALQQGDHGCPILLVGIGLQHTQHTQQVLGNPPDGSAGISRIAEPITLAPLSADDAVKAIAGNMLAMGYDIPEATVAALAEASQGFPQHIHGYLAGRSKPPTSTARLNGALPWTLRCRPATKREPTTTTPA